MTVLVTGGTGFVGSAVIRALLERGESVRAMTRAGSDPTLLDGLDLERLIVSALETGLYRGWVKHEAGNTRRVD